MSPAPIGGRATSPPETGTITRVKGREGPVSVELEDHPATPRLKGLTLPFWDQRREIKPRNRKKRLGLI